MKTPTAEIGYEENDWRRENIFLPTGNPEDDSRNAEGNRFPWERIERGEKKPRWEERRDDKRWL